jgi:hypothetical protein
MTIPVFEPTQQWLLRAKKRLAAWLRPHPAASGIVLEAPHATAYIDLSYLVQVSYDWGAHWRRQLGKDTVFQIDYDRLGEILGRGLNVQRFLFYDCLPEESHYAEPDREAPAHIQRRSKLHSTLRRNPLYDVRIRLALTSPFHSEQKEVDVALAVDMVQDAATTKHMILVTGDRDFRPAIEAVQRQGVHVTVAAFFQQHTHKALRLAANNVVDLDKEAIFVTWRYRGGEP